jgi:monoamine oxidase
MLDAVARAVFGAEPAQLSLLYFLFYLRSGGGMVSLAEDAQRAYFVGGAQRLAAGLAEALGERVRLGEPVRAVSQDAGGVTLDGDAARVRARRCVLAVPPPIAARIEIEPALAPDRAELLRGHPMGATVKVVATYDRRERGLSGEAVSSDGPVTATFDDTSPDGARPALLGFVVGDAARAWVRMPEAGRREAAAGAFARLFGPEAARPTGYVDFDWSSEEWTGGCPVALAGPGRMLGYAPALREPAGRIHFAGTETASEWCGYMEGALESAERAAAEALAGL